MYVSYDLLSMYSSYLQNKEFKDIKIVIKYDCMSQKKRKKKKEQCCWNSKHELQMIAYMYFLL